MYYTYIWYMVCTYASPESRYRPRKIVFILVYTIYNIKSEPEGQRYVNLFILNLSAKWVEAGKLHVWPRGLISWRDLCAWRENCQRALKVFGAPWQPWYCSSPAPLSVPFQIKENVIFRLDRRKDWSWDLSARQSTYLTIQGRGWDLTDMLMVVLLLGCTGNCRETPS